MLELKKKKKSCGKLSARFWDVGSEEAEEVVCASRHHLLLRKQLNKHQFREFKLLSVSCQRQFRFSHKLPRFSVLLWVCVMFPLLTSEFECNCSQTLIKVAFFGFSTSSRACFSPFLSWIHTAAFTPKIFDSAFQSELIRQPNKWNFFLLRRDRCCVSIKKKHLSPPNFPVINHQSESINYW